MQEVAVTKDELLALMKKICTADFVTDKGMLPNELCWEVFDKLVDLWPGKQTVRHPHSGAAASAVGWAS